ncbi:MAG: hypothetical protein Fur005_12230 [Roseiflexaceae bacterium]
MCSANGGDLLTGLLERNDRERVATREWVALGATVEHAAHRCNRSSMANTDDRAGLIGFCHNTANIKLPNGRKDIAQICPLCHGFTSLLCHSQGL